MTGIEHMLSLELDCHLERVAVVDTELMWFWNVLGEW